MMHLICALQFLLTLHDMVWILTGSESSWTFLENIWTASDRWGKGRWVRTWWTKSARVLYANGRNDSLVVQPLPIRTSSSNSWSMWGTNPVEEFEISAKCYGATGKFTCLRPLLAHNNCCLTLCHPGWRIKCHPCVPWENQTQFCLYKTCLLFRRSVARICLAAISSSFLRWATSCGQ